MTPSLLLAWALILIVHATPWMIATSPRLSSNPYKLSSFPGIITVLPYYTFLVWTGPSDIISGLQTAPENLLAQLGYYYTAMTLSVYAGIWTLSSQATPSQAEVSHYSLRAIVVATSILLVIFLAATAAKVSAAGGISHLLENLGRRTELLAGTGILSTFTQPAAFLCMFLLIYAKGSLGGPSWATILATLVVLFIGLSLFGGRKPSMYLLVFSMIAIDYYILRIRLFSPHFIFTSLLMAMFFTYVGEIRGSSEYGSLLDIQSIIDVIQDISYVDTYAYILDHFGRSGFWHGATFLDIIGRLGFADTAGSRGPLDEGVYIRSLYQGMSVHPPMDYDYLFRSSWPPETFGNGYLNFGFGGIILFGFIRGAVIGLFLKKCVINNFPTPFYMMFVFCAFNFHITNLRLVQFITTFLFIYAFTTFVPRKILRDQ